jgi:hypothetical protein
MGIPVRHEALDVTTKGVIQDGTEPPASDPSWEQCRPWASWTLLLPAEYGLVANRHTAAKSPVAVPSFQESKAIVW